MYKMIYNEVGIIKVKSCFAYQLKFQYGIVQYKTVF